MIIATAVAAVSLAACGKKEEAAPAAVTTSQNSFTVTTREGETVTSQVAVPASPATPGGPAAPAVPTVSANTPDYAPLYPGATVKATSTTTANDHKVGSVTYLTTASPRAVIDFYKPRVTAAGFATSADANIGVGLMYAATDPVKERTLQVIATSEKAGTAVVLSWTTPKS